MRGGWIFFKISKHASCLLERGEYMGLKHSMWAVSGNQSAKNLSGDKSTLWCLLSIKCSGLY